MRGKPRNPSKVMVRKLKMNEMLKEEGVFNQLVEMRKGSDNPINEEEWGGLKISNSIAVVDTERGLYLLDTEGVGYEDPINGEEKFEIGVYLTGKPNKDGLSSIAMMPTTYLSMDRETLLEVEYEEVPLHDFIRTHNTRLELNYKMWRDLLEPVAV